MPDGGTGLFECITAALALRWKALVSGVYLLGVNSKTTP